MRSKSKVEEWMNSSKTGVDTDDGDDGDSEDEEDDEGDEGDEGEEGELDMNVVEAKVFGGKTGERIHFLDNELKISTSCKYKSYH